MMDNFQQSAYKQKSCEAGKQLQCNAVEPEPTTTNRKKPSMIGPTATLLLLFCNNRRVKFSPSFTLRPIERKHEQCNVAGIAHRADILHLPTLMYVALELVTLGVQDALGASLHREHCHLLN